MNNFKEVFIKEADKKDIEKLVLMDETSFRKPWSKKAFEDEFYNEYSHIKIFESKNRICGFIIYRIFMEEMHIFRICSEIKSRRKKIAAKLLADAERDASGNAEHIFLEVESSNAPALNFYKKNGFRVIGTRKNYYGEGIDALNMTKDLSGGFK